MDARRTLATVVAAGALLAACGSGGTTAGSSAGTTTTAPATSASTTTTTLAGLEQPAIWPAADVVFATPDAAAADFVTKVLKVPASLGTFHQGDARSGEIDLLSPGEGGTVKVVRGVILLRQLGPHDGWFVLGVANDNATITSPASGAKVAAGPLVVSGKARGFEANVVVRAYLAGTTTELDKVVTSGGSMETPEPFTVTLDLSRAAPGDTVLVLVRGGTGLETDPGETGALPVVVGR